MADHLGLKIEPSKLMVNFNGKIDVVYTYQSTKIETLNARLKKVEVEVILTSNTVRRHETFIQSRRDESLKHHVNAIMDDDFWQVVKEEKLQEGDFQVESSMSFGDSHWCRPTPRRQATNIDQRRRTNIDRHHFIHIV
ncbi:hypothetical protein DY000_02016068 [Brassica cretica]|uniref:Uncharacterized protein n=1 Tax=Brassica cretica TaxID=69181 RepID=A0ABQ7D274_BRACR|nr:hypothetical protein DY000_02016068 [Brassica cretica]